MDKSLADNRVSVRIIGKGPLLVLFHSLLSDRGSFARIVPALSEHFTVVVPELPGFGGSEAVSGGLAAVADRMAQAIAELAGDEKPIVLGNGYGGFVALQMALRHPTLASRLVLADCGASFSDAGRAAFHGMANAAAEKGLPGIADVAMRRLFAPDFQAANPEIMADRRAGFLKTDPAVFREACLSLAALDLSQELGGLTLPVLVLVGEHDEATPVAMSVALAEGLPNATLKILPNCAHVPQLQAPELFLDALSGFLPELERMPSA